MLENNEKPRIVYAKTRRAWAWLALYDALLALQRGGCAICGKIPEGQRHILDGKSEREEARGVICKPCSLLVRQADNLLADVEVFHRILAYINASGEPNLSIAKANIPHYNLMDARPNISLRREKVLKRLGEIWQELGDGKRVESMKQVGREFGLSERTVRRYMGLS